MHLLKRKTELSFDRTYAAPVDAVWRAWTDPAHLLGMKWGYKAQLDKLESLLAG